MEFNATFLASAISFIVFTLIMNKVLYKPLTDIIAKRQAYLDANDNASSENLSSAKSIKEDKEKKVASSKSEAKNMIFAQIDASKEEKAQKEVEKKQEISEKLESQKGELQNEKNQLSEQIKGNVEELSDAVMSKFLGGNN